MPSMVLPAEPCTISIAAKRVRGVAAVLRSGVCAGTMESSNGSATVAPKPRRTVRREMCFLVMNIVLTPRGTCENCRLVFRPSHLERRAFHDAQNDRGKPIIDAGRFTVDGPNRRHVVVFEAAAQRIGQQLLSEGSGERIRMVHQCLPQAGRTIDFGAVHQLPRSVDIGPAVMNAPCSD